MQSGLLYIHFTCMRFYENLSSEWPKFCALRAGVELVSRAGAYIWQTNIENFSILVLVSFDTIYSILWFDKVMQIDFVVGRSGQTGVGLGVETNNEAAPVAVVIYSFSNTICIAFLHGIFPTSENSGRLHAMQCALFPEQDFPA